MVLCFFVEAIATYFVVLFFGFRLSLRFLLSSFSFGSDYRCVFRFLAFGCHERILLLFLRLLYSLTRIGCTLGVRSSYVLFFLDRFDPPIFLRFGVIVRALDAVQASGILALRFPCLFWILLIHRYLYVFGGCLVVPLDVPSSNHQ